MNIPSAQLLNILDPTCDSTILHNNTTTIDLSNIDWLSSIQNRIINTLSKHNDDIPDVPNIEICDTIKQIQASGLTPDQRHHLISTISTHISTLNDQSETIIQFLKAQSNRSDTVYVPQKQQRAFLDFMNEIQLLAQTPDQVMNVLQPSHRPCDKNGSM